MRFGEHEYPLFIICLAIFAIFVIAGIFFWGLLEIITPIYNGAAALPGPNWIAPLYDSLLGLVSFIDNSIWVAVILLIFADLAQSYNEPQRYMVIVNILGIFILAYIFYTLLPSFSQTANAIPFNSIFPVTTLIVSNGYLLFIMVLGMILSAIFNARAPN